MKNQQQDDKAKSTRTAAGTGGDSARLKTRNSQSGQQQGQHGGATQGDGKGKAGGRK